MVPPPPKTIAAIIAGVVIAITPALFGYLQSRDEISAKYRLTQDEAANGYTALATSVKELQAAMTAQHDYIVKLEGHLEAMDKFVLSNIDKPMLMPTVDGHQPPGKPVTPEQPPKPIEPPAKPSFGDLPADFTAATQQAAPSS